MSRVETSTLDVHDVSPELARAHVLSISVNGLPFANKVLAAGSAIEVSASPELTSLGSELKRIKPLSLSWGEAWSGRQPFRLEK